MTVVPTVDDQRSTWLRRQSLLHRSATPRALALLRLITGAYAVVWLVARSPYLMDLSRLPRSRWSPVGPWAWAETPPSSGVVGGLIAITVLLGIGFVSGRRFGAFGPAFAVAQLFTLAFSASWGQVLHTEHLVCLYLLVLGVAPSADALVLHRTPAGPAGASATGRRFQLSSGTGESAVRYGWPITVLMAIAVTTYVVAGYAKLRGGGIEWVTGDVLRNQIAHDNLRKELYGDPSSPLAGWLVGQGWLFTPMAMVAVVLELGAPLALLRHRVRWVWVAGIWVFHLAILVFMAVLFPFQLLGVALAPFLVDGRHRGGK